MPDLNLLALTDCSTFAEDTAIFRCEVNKVVNIMAWLSLPLAVGSVIVIGILLVASFTNSNSQIAASTLKKLAMVGIGLTIVFNAPALASIVV